MNTNEPSAQPLLVENNSFNTNVAGTLSPRSSNLMRRQNSSSTPDSRNTSSAITPEDHGKVLGTSTRAHQSSPISTRASSLLAWTRLLYTGSWTVEVYSFIIAVLSLAGLVATLLAHQNKPLPQWPQLVTINSVISLFSLLMRAGVGVILAEGVSQCKWRWFSKPRTLEHAEWFDSASRGSWGSIALLCRFRPRQAFYVAALGAFVTIMASLTGFFAQQLIQFANCTQIETSATVSLLRTNNYTQAGKVGSPGYYTGHPPMTAAINVGIMQPVSDMTNVLSRGCTSGNCTFPSTNGAVLSSVGMGYTCEDSTSQMYQLTEDHGSCKTCGFDYGENKTILFNLSCSPYTLRTWAPAVTYPGPITTIYMLYNIGSPYEANSLSNFRMVNCSLYPTIDTYSASINGSVLDEKIIDSVPIRTSWSQFPSPPEYDAEYSQETHYYPYHMATNQTLLDGTWISCDGSPDPRPGMVRFFKSTNTSNYTNIDGKVVPSAGSQYWYYPPDCVWSMFKGSVDTMAETFVDIFDNQNVSMSIRQSVVGPIHLLQLYQDGNMTIQSVEQVMENLTRSMTAVIRNDGKENGVVVGTVWTNTTCVYIRWRWISFPAVMIALTGVFLVLVVIENRGVKKDLLWKSSLLAALFCEVYVLDRPEGKREMLATAKSTSVSIEEHTGTLRLVQQ